MQHRTRQSRTTQRRATLIGFVSSLLLTAGTAHADITTFTPAVGNSGFWNDSDNWDNGVPTAADRAVIPAGKTCTINISSGVAFADTIEVQASGGSIGQLIINANKKLTLDNNDANTRTDPDNSRVNGKVTLNGADAVLEFIDNDHAISGTGEIHGTNSNARIEIEAGVKFTSRLARGGVTGAMIIKGIASNTDTGTFRNDGLVKASVVSSTLELHANTKLEDHATVGTATWTSTSVHRAILLFSRDASLNGDFILSCPNNNGRINIDADVDTCGDLQFDGGRLLIFKGNTFRYGGFAGTSTNPGSSISVGCLNWEIVSTDANPYDVTRTCD